ncbi:MAG: dephospho-CoA kinase [Chloroflexi bacterium RBG_13_56_8]|nr:MAG: dephospho-CoA kinase [Chloroflexi bacterium RBG_13_56_8]
MFVIGLTGNIATGKSTVAAMLKSLGACVIDADSLAHWAMRTGTEAHDQIVERFGAEMLLSNGRVDREKLASLVFGDPPSLRDLERIVHPVVVKETLRRLALCDASVAVVEAIKLIEANLHQHCDAVWVVTCQRDQQIDRLVRTRGFSCAQAELRVDVQSPASEKVAHADVVIDNSDGLEEAWGQVLRAWNAIPGAQKVPLDSHWDG